MSSRIQLTIDAMKSSHQQRVEAFMNLRGFNLPDRVSSHLDDDDRYMLARLVMEETLEYLEKGLGVTLCALEPNSQQYYGFSFDDLDYELDADYNVIEIIDGVCDVQYVTTQAFSFLGVPDEPFQAMVDTNNLLKFSAGHYIDSHEKLIKPDDHPSPQISKLFESLGRNA